MTTEDSSWKLHVDSRKWLENLGSEPWITVYQRYDLDSENIEDKFIWSFLLDKEKIQEELEEYQFEQFDGMPITGHFDQDDKIIFYNRFGVDDREPLTFNRQHVGKTRYFEISQEFIHFFDLYFDRPNNQFLLISPEGDEEQVVRIFENKIEILVYRLKQYLAFKNMDLIVCVVIRRFFNDLIEGDYSPTNSKTVMISKKNNYHYALWYQDYGSRKKYVTELIGKAAVKGMPLELTGLPPFEGVEEFETFIIGQDDNGIPISHSCNPNQLRDYYGKNPGAPFYTTPVYFSKNVLGKYYGSPEKFRVEDGSIYIGNYILRADTNHPDLVMVFLGDLGTDISFKEQKYWKSFNILPTGEMSKVAYRRAFLGEFEDPVAEQFVFRNAFKDLQEAWGEKYGFEFFKPLNDSDEYRYGNLHVPVENAQLEFDQQIQMLAIILVDSINKKEFDKLLIGEEPPKNSIQSLERFCLINQIDDYDQHISFLHNLYRLRSKGVSHKKDTIDYPKIREKFRVDEDGYINSFRNIMKQSIALLQFFSKYANKT